MNNSNKTSQLNCTKNLDELKTDFTSHSYFVLFDFLLSILENRKEECDATATEKFSELQDSVEIVKAAVGNGIDPTMEDVHIFITRIDKLIMSDKHLVINKESILCTIIDTLLLTLPSYIHTKYANSVTQITIEIIKNLDGIASPLIFKSLPLLSNILNFTEIQPSSLTRPSPFIYDWLLGVLRNKLPLNVQTKLFSCFTGLIRLWGIALCTSSENGFPALRLALRLAGVNVRMSLDQALEQGYTASSESQSLAESLRLSEILSGAMAADTDLIESLSLQQGLLEDILNGFDDVALSIIEFYNNIDPDKEHLWQCLETQAVTRYLSHWVLLDPSRTSVKFLPILDLLVTKAPLETFIVALPPLVELPLNQWVNTPNLIRRAIEALQFEPPLEQDLLRTASSIISLTFLNHSVNIQKTAFDKLSGGPLPPPIIPDGFYQKEDQPCSIKLPHPPFPIPSCSPVDEEMTFKLCTASRSLFCKHKHLPLLGYPHLLASVMLIGPRLSEESVSKYLTYSELKEIWTELATAFFELMPQSSMGYLEDSIDVDVWLTCALVLACSIPRHSLLGQVFLDQASGTFRRREWVMPATVPKEYRGCFVEEGVNDKYYHEAAVNHFRSVLGHFSR